MTPKCNDPKRNNPKTRQPQNATTLKCDNPKMRQPQNAITPKLPKKKGQERASSDFHNFFPEQQLNLLVSIIQIKKYF